MNAHSVSDWSDVKVPTLRYTVAYIHKKDLPYKEQ